MSTSENFWDLIKPGAVDVRGRPAGIVSQMMWKVLAYLAWTWEEKPRRQPANPGLPRNWLLKRACERVCLSSEIAFTKFRTFPGFSCSTVIFQVLLHFITLRAKLGGAVYCNRFCLWVSLCVYLCECGSVTTITRNCVHRSSPNWVCR